MAATKRVKRDIDRNLKYIESYGCDVSAYKNIRLNIDKNGRIPQDCFRNQKGQAKFRGISWSLSLYEWWSIWAESKKWELKGRGVGEFVMGRKQDSGGYSLDNVEITSSTLNIISSYGESGSR